MDRISIEFEKIIREFVDSNEFIINETTDLFNDLGLDSLSFLQMIMTIESAFDITIIDKISEFSDITKYNTLLKLVNEKIKMKGDNK